MYNGSIRHHLSQIPHSMPFTQKFIQLIFYTQARLLPPFFFFFTMFTKCLYMVVCRKLYTVFKFVLLQMFYVCVRPPPHLALWCCVVAVCCKDFAWRGSRSNNTQITRKWSRLLTDLEREKTALGRSTSHACNAILPFFVRFCLLCHSRECFVADNALPVTSPRVMTKACWGREKMLACNLTNLRARVMLKR